MGKRKNKTALAIIVIIAIIALMGTTLAPLILSAGAGTP